MEQEHLPASREVKCVTQYRHWLCSQEGLVDSIVGGCVMLSCHGRKDEKLCFWNCLSLSFCVIS